MLQIALNRVLEWILVSAADPNEVSLTIRGLLIAVVPSILFALGLAHVNLGQEQLTGIIDATVAFIGAALQAIGYAIALWGVIRKAWYTVFN